MMRARFRPVVSASHVPHIVLAPGEHKTIGRSNDADVVIEEPSLSRIHAVVSMGTDGTIAIEALKSTNGLFVNGQPRRSATLCETDRVRLGIVEYELEADQATTPLPLNRTIVRMAVPEEASGAVDRTGLEALLATSRDLMAFGDLQGLLDRVLDRLQTILKPDRSAILLLEANGSLTPRAVRPAGAYGSVSEFASATVVREALLARDVLVAYDAQLDARLQGAASVVMAGVRAAICVPLLGRSGPIGALYADQLAHNNQAFSPEQVQYASAFAAHAAAALETARLYDDREQHFRTTLEALAKAIDARDRYTAGHSERVTTYTLVLANQLGLPAGEIEIIRRAGMLHDIGKVGVPDRVLLKAGPLDPEERAIMESHVTIGYEMLEGVAFLRESLPAIRGHHERWDGRGYPDKLAGSAIHPHARLMAVADSYDAMTSARPYRNALSVEEAARRLRADSGMQFDPSAIATFDAVEKEFLAIHGRTHTIPSA